MKARLAETETDRLARQLEMALTLVKIEAAQLDYAREWFGSASTLEARVAKSNVIGVLQSHLRQLQAGAYVAPAKERRVCA